MYEVESRLIDGTLVDRIALVHEDCLEALLEDLETERREAPEGSIIGHLVVTPKGGDEPRPASPAAVFQAGNELPTDPIREALASFDALVLRLYGEDHDVGDALRAEIDEARTALNLIEGDA